MAVYILERRVQASALHLHPPHLEWSHRMSWSNNPFKALDKASVRRGWQVYKNVCAACHSLSARAYRMFIDEFMTEKEAKAEAAQMQYDDFDDKGQPVKRPGVISDYIQNPYPNDKAAAAANNGAAPPDLTRIVLARMELGREDYIFHLLTSYTEDVPAGVDVGEGKAYNPYFEGGVLAMTQQLFDDGVEFEDGTPATVSQQAKDVSNFLVWASEPWHDQRKRLALKILLFTIPMGFVLLYWKRFAWSYYKTQQYAWRVVKGREPPAAKDAMRKGH